MKKNTDQKNEIDEDTISDLDILFTIRYLDPDTKPEPSNALVVITVLSVVLILCAVCILLKLRGL